MRNVGPAHPDIPQEAPLSPLYEGKTACDHNPAGPSPLPVLVGTEDGNQVNSFLFNGRLGERRDAESGGRIQRERHSKSSQGCVEKTAGEMGERQEMG